jgi:hypothetical protein
VQRREFLGKSLAASALALGGTAGLAQSADTGKQREYYELRRYQLQSGPQTKLTDAYLAEALIPALNRMGMSPIGAFNLSIGPNTPEIYVLIPSPSLEQLVTAELKLGHDEEFLKKASAFWSAPATAPAYLRYESQLMIAFEGWPKMKLPESSTSKAKRVFQLRTYESPSNSDHVTKVKMFHSGEFDIFQRAGFGQIFYGDVLIGPRLPKLTYMLTFGDLSELDAKWQAFGNDPDWKKLSHSQEYAFEEIVSNIDNLILTPKPYSQI